MDTKEKRNEIYALIYDQLLNKEVAKKDWYKIRDEIGKKLKEYESLCGQTKTVIKEKIIYKEKPKEKGYWDV